MDFTTMTVNQLKAYLDEHNVDYSKAKVKADYITLAQSTETVESPATDSSSNLTEKVQSALQIEKTVTASTPDTSYLDGKDYSQLSVAERALIRQKSPEYVSVSNGITVQVTDRLPTGWRVIKLADNSYSRLFNGKIYTLSQVDYDVIKTIQVKVKTEATKDKCCGQAVWELINLVEVVNG